MIQTQVTVVTMRMLVFTAIQHVSILLCAPCHFMLQVHGFYVCMCVLKKCFISVASFPVHFWGEPGNKVIISDSFKN